MTLLNWLSRADPSSVIYRSELDAGRTRVAVQCCYRSPEAGERRCGVLSRPPCDGDLGTNPSLSAPRAFLTLTLSALIYLLYFTWPPLLLPEVMSVWNPLWAKLNEVWAASVQAGHSRDTAGPGNSHKADHAPLAVALSSWPICKPEAGQFGPDGKAQELATVPTLMKNHWVQHRCLLCLHFGGQCPTSSSSPVSPGGLTAQHRMSFLSSRAFPCINACFGRKSERREILLQWPLGNGRDTSEPLLVPGTPRERQRLMLQTWPLSAKPTRWGGGMLFLSFTASRRVGKIRSTCLFSPYKLFRRLCSACYKA